MLFTLHPLFNLQSVVVGKSHIGVMSFGVGIALLETKYRPLGHSHCWKGLTLSAREMDESMCVSQHYVKNQGLAPEAAVQ
jgi:hypothetical protein